MLPKSFLSLLLAVGFAVPLFAAAPSAEERAARLMEVSREVVEARLATLDASLLDYRLDDAVFRRIVNYLENWPISTGRMLAKSARYFPIFEEQLRVAGLPPELKYLSIPESALRPWATSRVGAGGLWQLMPGTARELGLTVNGELDERLDPALGCAGGLAYLAIQHRRYGDWALALAAYNSGPGRVNRAIRRSGHRNFWKLRRFLPRETRDYVPNFIAAVYLMTYHHRHGVVASPMELDLQITEGITVHRRLSLYRVAQLTGLRPDVVIELNPQYLRGYLPGYPGGHQLRLPSRVMPAFREYLAHYPAGAEEAAADLPWTHPRLATGELDCNRYYRPAELAPAASDTLLRQVALTHGLPVDRLAIWSNRGERDTLAVTDRLAYFVVEDYLAYGPPPRDVPPPTPRLPFLPPQPLPVGATPFRR